MDHSRLQGVMQILFSLKGGAFIAPDHAFVELFAESESGEIELALEVVGDPKSMGKITQAIGQQSWHPQLTRPSAMERIEHEGNCLIQLDMESGAVGIGDLKGS